MAYLNDDINDFSYWERAADLGTAVQRMYSESLLPTCAYSPLDPRVMGIIMDQEPQDTTQYPLLLRMLCLMKDSMGELATELGTDRAQI
ncbi:hypothetical protein KIPB_014770, partial [Kipferlia bialata]|eukprot:g14770.t1